MRKKFRNQDTGKTSSTAQLTDSCFCCHKLVSVNIVGTLCWLLALPMLVCMSWWVKMINNIGRMRRWARSKKKKVSSVSVPLVLSETVGHWAAEWLAKHECFYCGQQVHIRSACQGRIQGGWIGWISTPHFSVKKKFEMSLYLK